MLRLIGFAGILALTPFAAFGLVQAVSHHDWRGFALMLFFVGLLVMFARMLWLGRRASRASSIQPLVPGWGGQPFGVFVREQVAVSPEGRILVVGSAVSILVAAATMLWPGILPYRRDPGTLAVLFGMWPLVSFAFYVRICGPDFNSSVSKVVQILLIVCAPFVLAAR